MTDISAFFDPVLLSLQTAAAALVVVFIGGTAAAGFMKRRPFFGKTFVETIFLLPTVLPPTVTGFLLIVIFGNQHIIGRLLERIFQQSLMFTWWAAVLAAAVVAFPFMYQSVKTGLQQVDENIEHAARTDGAGEWKVFLFISLPLSSRAVISGVILSFTRALGEFGATFMFAGNLPGVTRTVPIAVFTAMESNQMQLAWAWAASVVVLSFSLLFLLRKWSI
ncbi:molybdate ABC transporter permease subunit [Salibacterium halotolerans]|uniref:Molybdenum transport system permease n=1 Tax=Salibacterium halotolerans TaxID=1884432 RepID=A0A1I5QFU1_9BACI|nr:molybdate ABC transporter permease subunit [Salibacterium halotolerans]SFP45103.1 molybdate transport system permease protein [Salibacterium halotolerans]